MPKAPTAMKAKNKISAKASAKIAPETDVPVSATPPLSFEFIKSPVNDADTAVIAVFADKKLSPAAKLVDQMLGGLIQHQLDSHKTFKAGDGHTLNLALPPKAPYLRMVILGLGDKDKLTAAKLEQAGGRLLGALNVQGSDHAVFLNLEEMKSTKLNLAMHLCFGMRLGTYQFENYKTAPKEQPQRLKILSIISTTGKALLKDFAAFEDLAQATFLARDLVNEPPNILYPESYAAQIEAALAPLGVEIEILDDEQMAEMGMNLMIAVGQASEHKPRMVTMIWPGSGSAKERAQQPIAFVGKGITFDTGGLNVKPFEGMLTMKCDMGGSAAVVGAMQYLAKQKCRVPVVGIVALAENSISDEATRPSDVIKSYSGKTVEILNTDAEGRLVLADALTYVQQKHDPKVVIDLATLTGAILVALGDHYAGTFTRDDNLWKKLSAASVNSGEEIWRMPLADHHRRELDSPFADIKNIGGGRFAGSSTAAAFLEEFVDKGRAWAHIDIAGTATIKGPNPLNPKPFGSGYGVRLLADFVKAYSD